MTQKHIAGNLKKLMSFTTEYIEYAGAWDNEEDFLKQFEMDLFGEVQSVMHAINLDWLNENKKEVMVIALETFRAMNINEIYYFQ